MISLSHLNKLILFTIFFIILFFNTAFGEDEPADIWKNTENLNEQNNESNSEINNKKSNYEFPMVG